MPVINIIEDLLLLVVSTCIDPLDIEILIINIIEDLLLLAASTVTYRKSLAEARFPPKLTNFALL